jgi:hypothetical protein
MPVFLQGKGDKRQEKEEKNVYFFNKLEINPPPPLWGGGWKKTLFTGGGEKRFTQNVNLNPKRALIGLVNHHSFKYRGSWI